MAKIELKQVTLCLRSGLAGTAEITTAAPTATDTSVDIDSLVINSVVANKVPVGAKFTVSTAGNDTEYEVLGIVTDAVGADEVQTMTANGATAGTFSLQITFNSVVYVVSGIAYNETAANIETAIDAAITDTSFTAGDISVGGGPADSVALTFTFDGASVAKVNQPLIVADLSGLTAPTGGVISETTQGLPAGSTTGLVFDPEWGATATPSLGDTITFLPQEADVKVGDGNITYTLNKNIEYELDRGLLDTVREGDEAPMDITLDFSYENVRTGTGEAVSPVDIFLQEGAAAEWRSSSDDECEPYAIDVLIKHTAPCGTSLNELTIFEDVRCDSIDFDIDGASISVTARSNRTRPTYSRTTDPLV